MHTENRPSDVSVIQHLLDTPHRFEFVQAVRIVLRWLVSNGVTYERAWTQVLRFQNSLSLNFPVSEIEAMQAGRTGFATDTGLLRELREQPATRITVTPAFLGLLGITGAMPLHITERIAESARATGAASARAFVDIFSQRMVGMFFHAWGKYRLEHQLDIQGKDRLLPLLRSLAGQCGDQPPGDPPAEGIGHAVGYYSAALRTRPVAPSTIARTLSDYFGVPMVLETFVAAWDVIPDQQRGKLGNRIARLGCGATLGGRLNRRDRRVRLHIGPLEKADLQRFLPRSAGAAALAEMVALFSLPHLEFEVRLGLKPACIGPVRLNAPDDAAQRLGWGAFLVRPGGKVRSNTIGYMLAPPVFDEPADQ